MARAREAGEDLALDDCDVTPLCAGRGRGEQALGDVWSAGKPEFDDDASASLLQRLVSDLEWDQRAR
ncbi:MAG: hypothetical protein DMD96_06265 [Candidatus Rokuibacteriota bacterium]|nr:MAG: hypothetical protein DMD96_06265 [Candidatus Rokubacteria bacterium]